MNTAIFDAIKDQGGLGLTSPALEQTIDAKAKLSQALSQVKSLPVATPPLTAGFPPAWTDSTVRAIEASMVQLDATSLTLTQKLTDLLPNISHASITGRINGVPSSCTNLFLATGSLTGELTEPLLGLLAAGADYLTQIDAYLSGLLDESALMAMLDPLSEQLSAFGKYMATLFDKENALLAELINTITASSLTQTLTLLWDNPCAKALLNETLPPNIKALLP
ncbi:hypothetical protein [Shewanella baltica]|uniref:hypothetical protein n=1 Tax=Shewanella baltica TaxID=62322 RepID=UPI003D0397AC